MSSKYSNSSSGSSRTLKKEEKDTQNTLEEKEAEDENWQKKLRITGHF